MYKIKNNHKGSDAQKTLRVNQKGHTAQVSRGGRRRKIDVIEEEPGRQVRSHSRMSSKGRRLPREASDNEDLPPTPQNISSTENPPTDAQVQTISSNSRSAKNRTALQSADQTSMDITPGQTRPGTANQTCQNTSLHLKKIARAVVQPMDDSQLCYLGQVEPSVLPQPQPAYPAKSGLGANARARSKVFQTAKKPTQPRAQHKILHERTAATERAPSSKRRGFEGESTTAHVLPKETKKDLSSLVVDLKKKQASQAAPPTQAKPRSDKDRKGTPQQEQAQQRGQRQPSSVTVDPSRLKQHLKDSNYGPAPLTHSNLNSLATALQSSKSSGASRVQGVDLLEHSPYNFMRGINPKRLVKGMASSQKQALVQVLSCSFCQQIIVEGKECPECENNFCQPCYASWLTSASSKYFNTPCKCDGDQTLIGLKAISKMKSEQLHQIRFKCTNTGCPYLLSYDELVLGTHELDDCMFLKIRCEGCGVKIPKYEQIRHDTMECKNPHARCKYCQLDCHMKELVGHERTCDQRSVVKLEYGNEDEEELLREVEEEEALQVRGQEKRGQSMGHSQIQALMSKHGTEKRSVEIDLEKEPSNSFEGVILPGHNPPSQSTKLILKQARKDREKEESLDELLQIFGKQVEEPKKPKTLAVTKEQLKVLLSLKNQISAASTRNASSKHRDGSSKTRTGSHLNRKKKAIDENLPEELAELFQGQSRQTENSEAEEEIEDLSESEVWDQRRHAHQQSRRILGRRKPTRVEADVHHHQKRHRT